ncbi:MAG: methyltransferase domain-containing protein [Candidatus Zixiibacteriota bacterium]|nr:MAG: methyltransferase domain-containing protein [candidate division Zixibacteria bacterium]
MQLLDQKLGAVSGGKILDVATQDGEFIRKLLNAFKNYDEAIGIDISEKQFTKAKENFKDDRVSFRMMDGGNLLFADEAFDTVSICCGLHHLPDVSAVLDEMKRVLKSGGRFIVREQFCDNQTEKQMSDVLLHHWGAKIGRMIGKTHNSTFKKHEIIDMVKRLNLSDFETKEYICRECDPEKDGKMADELADIDKELSKIEKYPGYDELKKEGEQLKHRIMTTGFACATFLDIIGSK